MSVKADHIFEAKQVQYLVSITHACVEISRCYDEVVHDVLDLLHEVGDGRLLGLRRTQVLVAFQQGLEKGKTRS